MEDRSNTWDANTNNTGKVDPFPVDTCINILSLVASAISAYITYKSWNRSQYEQKNHSTDKELMDITLDIHNLLDDLILIIGQIAPELKDRKLRFKKGGIQLPLRQLKKYDEIENKISDILFRIKKLSSILRENMIGIESDGEFNYYMDEYSKPFDDLLDNFSNMTFTSFFSALRDILNKIEIDLHKNR